MQAGIHFHGLDEMAASRLGRLEEILRRQERLEEPIIRPDAA
jgi:hypothetical protein